MELSRLCERCKKPVDAEWMYAWCEGCGKTGTCHHGNRPHECNQCMMESDAAYDAGRVDGDAPRRSDDPPE